MLYQPQRELSLSRVTLVAFDGSMPTHKKDSSNFLNAFTPCYNNATYANATGFESINSTFGETYYPQYPE